MDSASSAQRAVAMRRRSSAARHSSRALRRAREGWHHGSAPTPGRSTAGSRNHDRPRPRSASFSRPIASVVAMAMLDVDADVSGSVDRRLWLRVLAGLFGLFWGFFFYGLIDLLAFAQGEQFHAALLLSTGWGLLFLFLVAAPLVALAVRASAVSPSALAQVALVAAAVITAAALSSSPRYLSGGGRASRHGRGAGARCARSPVGRAGGMALVGPPRHTRADRRRTVLRLRLDVGADDR